MKQLITVLFFCYSMCFASPGFAGITQEVEAYSQWHLESKNLPGAAIAMVENGQLTYLKGFGLTDTTTHQAVDEHTIFRLASVSKSISAILAVQLQQNGQLTFEQPLGPLPIKRFPKSLQALTLKQILSQTSGVSPNFGYNEVFGGGQFDEIIANFHDTDTLCEPGQCYTYQNLIYSLLASKIQLETQQSFYQHLSTELLQPLNMDETTLTAAQWLATSNKALGHQKIDGAYHSFISDARYDAIIPAGGMASSVHDMGQLILEMITHHKQVIDTDAVNQLSEQVIKTPVELKRFNSQWRLERLKDAHYGLGWRVYDYAGAKTLYHSGMIKGFTSCMAILPEQQAGIVVLTNAESAFASNVTAYFLDKVLNLPEIKWE